MSRTYYYLLNCKIFIPPQKNVKTMQQNQITETIVSEYISLFFNRMSELTPAFFDVYMSCENSFLQDFYYKSYMNLIAINDKACKYYP